MINKAIIHLKKKSAEKFQAPAVYLEDVSSIHSYGVCATLWSLMDIATTTLNTQRSTEKEHEVAENMRLLCSIEGT